MATGDRKQCEACGVRVLAGPPEPWRRLAPLGNPLSEDREIVRRRERARMLRERNAA